MKIVLLGKGFISWGGGIDCLKFYISALLSKSNIKKIQLYLLIPQESQFNVKVKNRLRPLKKMLVDIINGKRPHYVSENSIDKEGIIKSFHCFEDKVDILFYSESRTGLVDTLKKIDADVVIPSIDSLGKEFPYPWVGYLYDFQHKYYSEFFTASDIENRNKAFSVMLNDAKAVIVNALDVKNDILKYYPATKAQIYNLPFTPIPRKEWFSNTDNDITEKYSLQKKYFMISNQFWIHKSHSTAFEALAILHNKGIDNYDIICTGNTYDYRFPNYFNELKEKVAQLGLINKVRFLGYISKEDQIQIMRKSVGVLQPTLFEGGPGGGATYDAVALGIPVIVSDIPVNKEIVEENVFFFKTKSPEDMADKMLNLIRRHENNEFIKSNPELLIEKGNARLEILGDRLLEAIDCVMNSSK